MPFFPDIPAASGAVEPFDILEAWANYMVQNIVMRTKANLDMREQALPLHRVTVDHQGKMMVAMTDPKQYVPAFFHLRCMPVLVLVGRAEGIVGEVGADRWKWHPRGGVLAGVSIGVERVFSTYVVDSRGASLNYRREIRVDGVEPIPERR